MCLCLAGAFWLRRAIWLSIIICMIFWLFFQLRLCVLRLSAGGTVRTWSQRNIADIPVPAITVCHGNGFKKSVVLRHQSADTVGWQRWHQQKYQTLNWSSFDGLDQFYQAASYGWSDMVLSCKISGKLCNDIGTLRTSTTLIHGLCTTFVSNITVTKRLTSAQLIMVLREKEPLDDSEFSGWNLFLHPQDTRYSEYLFFSGLVAPVKISSNRLHEVKVFHQITESLPYGEEKGCSTDENALPAYEQCLNRCMKKQLADGVIPATAHAPSCTVPWLSPKIYGPNTPSCRTMAELERSSLNTHKGVNEMMFINWIGGCHCSLPCRKDQYEIEEHEKWHVDETNIYLSYPGTRNATVGVLLLRLLDIEKKVVERDAYPFDTFLADVGGNLGLLLGGSLLTFVELVDYVIASCLSRLAVRPPPPNKS